MKWFPFMKLGKHTDSKGDEFDATNEKLDKIIEMNKGREMPIAIGHPKNSSPAWGWVDEIKRVGDILYAKPKQLVAEFENMVKKSMFKNISVSFNKDLTIRHFGFLGATPPAIEGLTAEFAEGGEETVVEFAAPVAGKVKQFFLDMLARMGDALREMEDNAFTDFASPDADKAAQQARAKKYGIGVKEGGNVTKPSEYSGVPDDEFMDPVNYRYPIDAAHIQGAMGYWGMPDNRSQYSADEVKSMTKRMFAAAKKHGKAVDEEKWNFEKEKPMPKTVQELEAELAAEKAKVAEFAKTTEKVTQLTTELTAERRKNQAQEFNAFLTGPDMAKKVSPAMMPAMLDFMGILAGVQTYEFSAPDPQDAKKTVKVAKAPLEAFKDFAKAHLPDILTTEEIATKKKAGDKETPHEFMAKVAEFSKEHKVSEGKAIIEVAHAEPKLHEEWLASLKK